MKLKLFMPTTSIAGGLFMLKRTKKDRPALPICLFVLVAELINNDCQLRPSEVSFRSEGIVPVSLQDFVAAHVHDRFLCPFGNGVEVGVLRHLFCFFQLDV